MNRSIVLLAIVATLFSACDNDLNLTTDWQDIPVVYGIVALNDTAHYFRVEKAFLDPQTNALVLAQNPDSIYYDEVTVELERPSLNETLILERVDGNLEGYPRAEGVFTNTPNYLYKLKLPRGRELTAGERINLTVSRDDESTPATASTTVIGEFTFINNRPGNTINWSRYERRVNLSWRPEENSFVFDVVFEINIEESINNGPFVRRTLDWEIAQNFTFDDTGNSSQLTVQPLGEEFYNFIGGALEEQDNVRRRFVDMDLVITAGGDALLDYISIRQANTGLTSSQVIPVFSNIEEGLGLFSSVYTIRKEDITITPDSRDSLQNGFYTDDLNFVE